MYYILIRKDNEERRAMQTVLYECLTALTKLLTPILPHTADEVWGYIPGIEEVSVQLTNMPEYVEIPNAKELELKWENFLKLRDDVLKALEEARNEKLLENH